MVLEPEVIVLLVQLDDLPVSRVERAVRATILVRQESFLPRRLKAAIDFFVKVPLGMELGENRLHHLLMPRLGGADEIVVGQLQLRGKGLPHRSQLIAIGLRTLALGHCRLLDFLAVLIQAGQEERLLPQAAPRAAMTSAMTFS